MPESNKDEHYFISFIKENLFPLLGLIGAIFTLWGMTQTLPLKAEIKLAEQANLANAQEISELKTDKANKEAVEILTQNLEDKYKSIDKKLDDLIELHNREMSNR